MPSPQVPTSLPHAARGALQRLVPKDGGMRRPGQATILRQRESIGGSRSELGLVAAGDINPTSLSHGVQTHPSLWRLTCMLGPAVSPLVIVWDGIRLGLLSARSGSSRG